ncbi:MAG TPA: polymer-forming cytoskeletal protein [Bacillota bacterium]|nr:polymer-forming cytoskeletal protein [Bacillota bacterium]HPT87431.1 polymer-forming cytoskeletal protein [Bacillota bacterium]
MKKIMCLLLSGLLLMLLAFPAAAQPWTIARGTTVIRQGESIKGDYYFRGETLEVAGDIEGDLLVLAGEVIITGNVKGNLLGVVWEKLTVNGSVAGDLRVAAGQLELNGTVGETLASAAMKAEINSSARVDGGMLGYYHQLALRGTINGPVRVTGYAATTVGGVINGSFHVRGVPVKWLEKAVVEGDVDDYTGVTDTSRSSQATIRGEYRMHQNNEMLARFLKAFLLFSLMWFMGNILIGLVFYKLFPRTSWKITEPSVMNFKRYLKVGLLGSFGIPLLIVVLFLTQVGIPLAVLLILVYIILLLFSNVLLYLWIGRIIFLKSSLNTRRHPVLLIITGGFGLTLLGFIPLVGHILQIIGVGMVLANIRPEIESGSSRLAGRGDL